MAIVGVIIGVILFTFTPFSEQNNPYVGSTGSIIVCIIFAAVGGWIASQLD